MASTKEYLSFILEQLSELNEITYRAMMGEYIIYYQKKIIGGIYDDRLLVKPVQVAKELMPEASYELPYEGAKEMLLVQNVNDKCFLQNLFESMYDELPENSKKKWFNNIIHIWYCMIFLIIIEAVDAHKELNAVNS